METFYYSYDDLTKIVYWSTYLPDRPELIYLGTSDNQNKRMAVQALFKNKESGFRLRELV